MNRTIGFPDSYFNSTFLDGLHDKVKSQAKPSSGNYFHEHKLCIFVNRKIGMV